MSNPGLRSDQDAGPEHDGLVFEVPNDEDRVLDYTLRQRQAIIVSMTGEEGEDLKGLSPRELDVVLAALDGMDRVALGRKRLKSENIALANQAAAAAMIARILGAPGIGQAGQRPAQQADALQGAIPMLPPGVPEPVLVPGEADIEAAQMNVDTFMAGFGTTG